MSANLAQVFEDWVRKLQEPLGLDRWNIKVESGPDPEGTAGCAALPHYRTARLSIDPEKLETGDELDEFTSHELAHCHVWPIAAVADDLVVLVCELLPKNFVQPFAKMLKKQVEQAEETTTTDVGATYIRLLRRLWRAEDEVKALKAEIKQLKKVA